MNEIIELEALEGFWEDTDNAAKIQQEKSVVQSVVGSYDSIVDLFEEYDILLEYAQKDNDESAATEAISLTEQIAEKVAVAEQQALLSGETDPNNAIVSINAGAGGTESCDWAYMLQRMIVRYAESKRFKVQILDYQDGESAGIKSATMLIQGPYAFGALKSESGIHRLVRISPFDSNARRHTSFASIYVSPEIDDDIDIEINDNDLKIDVFRACGAGGQSVNTTDSAVRITHHPSGLVVVCRNERSQLQNKNMAMKVLKSRLYEKAMAEKQAEQDAIEATKKKIEWGSQIRSYVLHPYKMVKDHRTNFEVGTAEKVLDGDLEGFVKAFLQWNALGDSKKD